MVHVGNQHLLTSLMIFYNSYSVASLTYSILLFRFVITANEGRRAGRSIALKIIADEAMLGLPIQHCFIFARTETVVPMVSKRDVDWGESMVRVKTCNISVNDHFVSLSFCLWNLISHTENATPVLSH